MRFVSRLSIQFLGKTQRDTYLIEIHRKNSKNSLILHDKKY